MKKLFTLLSMGLLAVASQAEVLWEGSCTFAHWAPVDDSARPRISKEALASAQAGDKIVVNITDIVGDWSAVELYKVEPWGQLDNGSQHVEAGDTQASFTLTSEMADSLKTNGLTIAGTGYTATKISLEAPSSVIWEGEAEGSESWTVTPSVNLPGSSFVMAKLGDRLAFTVQKINVKVWAAIQINKADYSTYEIAPFKGERVLTQANEIVEFALDTQEAVDALKTSGINVVGPNFKLTKIELLEASVPSSIGSVEADDATLEDAPVYNLQGQRVADGLNSKLPAGLYIQRGRKILVK